MATLSEIRALTRDFISQENPNNTDFTDAELNSYANLGMRHLGKLVKRPTDMIKWQAEEGKSSYQLPNDALIMLTAYFGDVTIGGDSFPLQVLTEEKLKAVNPSWMSEDTQSRGKPSRIILLDDETLLLNPTPDSTQAVPGKQLRIRYVYQPANMVADSDKPNIPVNYHDYIAEYAHYLALAGKLNDPERARVVLGIMTDKAKRFESMIVKEAAEALGFGWGRAIDVDNFGGLTINR